MEKGLAVKRGSWNDNCIIIDRYFSLFPGQCNDHIIACAVVTYDIIKSLNNWQDISGNITSASIVRIL